jgi:hypothetical protein
VIYHAVFPVLDATPERVLKQQAMVQLAEMTRGIRITSSWAWRTEDRWLIASANAEGPTDIQTAWRYTDMLANLVPTETQALHDYMGVAA